MTTAQTSGYPLWARALVAATLSGIALMVGLGCIAGIGLKDIFRKATDRSEIEKVVGQIARFEHLPAAFRWKMAMDDNWLGQRMALLEHLPDRTTLALSVLAPQIREKVPDPRALVAKLAEDGIGPNMGIVIKDRGELSVAGQVMHYAVGPTRTASGAAEHAVQGFIGTVYLPERKRVLLLYGSTPGKEYNMEATRQLLEAIKSF